MNNEFDIAIRQIGLLILWILSIWFLISGCIYAEDWGEFGRYVGAWLVCVLYMI